MIKINHSTVFVSVHLLSRHNSSTNKGDQPRFFALASKIQIREEYSTIFNSKLDFQKVCMMEFQ
jgi:hypothetical protein